MPVSALGGGFDVKGPEDALGQKTFPKKTEQLLLIKG